MSVSDVDAIASYSKTQALLWFIISWNKFAKVLSYVYNKPLIAVKSF